MAGRPPAFPLANRRCGEDTKANPTLIAIQYIRTTIVSPGAVAYELTSSITDPASAERVRKFYEQIAIPAGSFARAVAFAMSQPEDVDVNEILFRPTRQEL